MSTSTAPARLTALVAAVLLATALAPTAGVAQAPPPAFGPDTTFVHPAAGNVGVAVALSQATFPTAVRTEIGRLASTPDESTTGVAMAPEPGALTRHSQSGLRCVGLAARSQLRRSGSGGSGVLEGTGEGLLRSLERGETTET